MPIMFFYFLKIIFDISISKRSKKYKPHSILAKKKKNSNLDKTQVQMQYQTFSKRGSWEYIAGGRQAAHKILVNAKGYCLGFQDLSSYKNTTTQIKVVITSCFRII